VEIVTRRRGGAYRRGRGLVTLLVGRVLAEFAAPRPAAVLLFVGQLLHLVPQQALEVVLGPRTEQTHSQVRVGEQRRERPTRLQCVLGAFLSRHAQHTSTSTVTCKLLQSIYFRPTFTCSYRMAGSVAEWLACWVQIAAATLSGNSLRQTVHTHRVSVHQAAKLVAVRLRVARATAGLVESNGSLPPGL